MTDHALASRRAAVAPGGSWEMIHQRPRALSSLASVEMHRLTRQTTDELNRSWFLGPAGNRIVENAIRHPSHSLRAVSVFWSPKSLLGLFLNG
ncbi:hypothetical protein CSAL01_08198 [Colletotrichum salicis]|uniref:Uncharacterized protein n=1 Tax=Colletotrichum salicis TaxID=1209931 RepID=A0A135UUU6_9PEZI|nr:hypothetical protein CSAL01_08198 [Colletotrichum salicis]